MLEGTLIYISNRNNKSGTGNDLSIIFNNSSDKKEGNSDRAYYSFYKKGEKVSWEINTVKMKIGITTVKYEDGKLYIEGNCTGEFSSTSAPIDQKAEIKDCKFEVII